MGLRYPNMQCAGSGLNRTGKIIRHGFYKTKRGKRCRCRCRTCGKTFCSNSGTPYDRLQYRRTTFGEVAALSVEDLNKSAIARVKRRAVIGAGWRFEQALRDSEDSSKLNTSFIERLNLTIRQNSAYLSRRTICHARCKERFEDHLALIRCYYNFIRPHRALKFGPEIRTPAMH